MSGEPAAQLAAIQAVSDTETDYGGRVPTWTDLATVWVYLKLGAATTQTLEGQPPVRIETASAAARDVPSAEPGQRLVATGAPWRILAIDRAIPGRMALTLDRMT